MGLVLEHQQPSLGLPVHIHIYEYAARIVLLADLQVIQQTVLPEVFRPDCGHIHQVQSLLLAACLRAHPQVQGHRPVDVLLDEGILHVDAFQFRCECRVAAVVAPVGVQNPEFGLVRIPAFLGEIFHNLGEVVGVHRKAHLFAICFQIVPAHIPESLQHGNRLDRRVFRVGQFAQVFRAGFHRIDVVVADLLKRLLGGVGVHDQKFGTLYADPRRGVDQVHAVHSRGRPLVELARQVLDSDVLRSVQIDRICDRVGHNLSEDAVAALLQKIGRESEQVVNIKQPKRFQLQLQVLVEFPQEALCLHLELRVFLHENAVIGHLCKFFLRLSQS